MDPPPDIHRGPGDQVVHERRHLTILFSDLCGSTRLGHATDPEILDAVLRHVKAAAFEVIARHGGTLIQFHGDGVLAVFGYPAPGEDDVRRATEAALDLHAAVRNHDLRHLLPRTFDLQMHSGIHSGLALVREGDHVQGRLELVGDAPNTAAGICARAVEGEILASRATLVGALPFFETEVVAPLVLKGKPEPMPAYRVLARSGIRTRFEASQRRGLAPFIGRRELLERLERGLERSRAGRSTRVRVVGDAGIGKTRAVEEFLRRARAGGSSALRGLCENEVAAAPLQPFRQALRRAFDLAPEADPNRPPDPIPVEDRIDALGLRAHAAELLALLSIRASGRPRYEGGHARGGSAGVRAFAALLRALSAEAPVILFMDDWQWADDTSRVVAGSLFRALHDAPILWILASRPTEDDPHETPDEEQIAVPPFRDVDSAAAIEALSPAGLDLGGAARLHQRSGGNPLFLEELCRTLDPTEVGAEAVRAVPSTLHGLIEHRVHSLPTGARAVLECAAVVGNTVATWLLQELTGQAPGDPLLDQLETDDLLYPGVESGTLRFKHGLTRDAVYQSVGLVERRRLHLRIAETLKQRYAESDAEIPYEALAYHFSGAARYSEAARYAEIAGDRAWASASLDRTRLQYGAALAALDQLPREPEVLRTWLDICKRRSFAGVFNPTQEQLEMLRRAVETGEALGDLDAVGHAYFWGGFTSYSLGDAAGAIEQYQRGLDLAERADNAKLKAQLRANLGETLAATCEYEMAEQLLDESIAAKQTLQSEPGPSRAPTGSAYALACKAFIAADRGETIESQKLFEQSLKSVEGSGHPVAGSCLAFRSSAELLFGDFEACLETSAEVETRGRGMNGPYLVGRGRAERAFSRFMLNGDHDALVKLEAAVEWLDQKSIRLYMSLHLACLAEAHVRTGNLDRARSYVERTLARAQALDRLGEGMAYRALARIEALEAPNDPARSDAAIHEALEIGRSRRSPRQIALARLAHAEITLSRGDRAAARRHLRVALPETQRMALGWYHEQARRLEAALERPA